jgi:hypothetical protein
MVSASGHPVWTGQCQGASKTDIILQESKIDQLESPLNLRAKLKALPITVSWHLEQGAISTMTSLNSMG